MKRVRVVISFMTRKAFDIGFGSYDAYRDRE